MDYGSDVDEDKKAKDSNEPEKKKELMPSALAEPIQDLVKLIFDKKMMTQQMVRPFFDQTRKFNMSPVVLR